MLYHNFQFLCIFFTTSRLSIKLCRKMKGPSGIASCSGQLCMGCPQEEYVDLISHIRYLYLISFLLPRVVLFRNTNWYSEVDCLCPWRFYLAIPSEFSLLNQTKVGPVDQHSPSSHQVLSDSKQSTNATVPPCNLSPMSVPFVCDELIDSQYHQVTL